MLHRKMKNKNKFIYSQRYFNCEIAKLAALFSAFTSHPFKAVISNEYFIRISFVSRHIECETKTETHKRIWNGKNQMPQIEKVFIFLLMLFFAALLSEWSDDELDIHFGRKSKQKFTSIFISYRFFFYIRLFLLFFCWFLFVFMKCTLIECQVRTNAKQPRNIFENK